MPAPEAVSPVATVNSTVAAAAAADVEAADVEAAERSWARSVATALLVPGSSPGGSPGPGIGALRILCRRPGHVRCGVAHPARADHRPGRFTLAQLGALASDPLLTLVPLHGPARASDAAPPR